MLLLFLACKIEIFYQNMHIWPKTSYFTPGVPMNELTPCSDGIFFKEQLILFKLNILFLRLVKYRGSNCHLFSKIRIFCLKLHI